MTPRRKAPESCIYLSPPWRAWGMPGAHCTRGLVCTCSGRKHTSNNEYTGTPGIPARNGFNGLCRALPGDRALLPPSSRGYLACPHPVGPTCLPQNLTPASGRQDHTILPSAATSLVSALFDRSQVFRLALRSHRAQNAAASTASRPYVRDDRETPLCVGRDTQSSRRDLGCAKTEIFLQRGLDYPNQIEKSQQIALHAQRPRREIRSIQLGGGNGIGLRLLQQLQCGFQAATQIGGGV